MALDVALPYRTDWREMSSVLDYCKGKGADRAALEARFGAGESLRETLNALEQLGLAERGDGGDVRLTVLGERLAYAPDGARQRERLIEAMLGYPPYRFPLERALAEQHSVLDGPWVEHIWQVDMRLGQPRNRVEEARTFFFRLADEAGLGAYRRGVRGQTTRFELAGDFEARLAPVLERLAADERAVAPRAIGRPVASVEPAGEPPLSVAPVDAKGDAGPARPGPLVVATTPGAAATGVTDSLAPSGVSIAIQVDMSDWELDKIRAFLNLIGYVPGGRE
jgi:hypothetical protein